MTKVTFLISNCDSDDGSVIARKLGLLSPVIWDSLIFSSPFFCIFKICTRIIKNIDRTENTARITISWLEVNLKGPWGSQGCHEGARKCSEPRTG